MVHLYYIYLLYQYLNFDYINKCYNQIHMIYTFKVKETLRLKKIHKDRIQYKV